MLETYCIYPSHLPSHSAYSVHYKYLIDLPTCLLVISFRVSYQYPKPSLPPPTPLFVNWVSSHSFSSYLRHYFLRETF